MPVDHIRYDILVQQALRGMVRDVLANTVKNGLIGDHHFFITFDTNADGVRLSERLHEQYPDEMTIVLQHQFWDLKVNDKAFEVGLSFGGVMERLVVPLAAIKGFADPSVQFGLQFETLTAEDEDTAESDGEAAPPARAKTPGRAQPARTSVPASPPAASPPAPAATTPAPPEQPKPASDQPGGDKSGAEVVRLDRFRKK